MADKELFQKALNFSYLFLKFRPRTKKEIALYLEKKAKRYHFSQDLIKKLIDYLTDINLINDQDFVSWFVQQRNLAKPKSKFVLTQELIRLGIDKILIDEYFSKNEIDEFNLAKQALTRRTSLLKNLKTKPGYQKAFNFLLRRGFSFEVTRKTIAEIMSLE